MLELVSLIIIHVIYTAQALGAADANRKHVNNRLAQQVLSRRKRSYMSIPQSLVQSLVMAKPMLHSHTPRARAILIIHQLAKIFD